jgi:3-phenylpropionate/trans-cinnamate dioxygenase ferredoxin subunit
MSEWVKVGGAGEVAEGEMISYGVGRRAVAIANLGGDLFAFDDLCSHQQCSLSEGDLDDTIVECPCHGSQFDITTGEAVVGPATEPLDVFKVREEDGELQVLMEADD